MDWRRGHTPTPKRCPGAENAPTSRQLPTPGRGQDLPARCVAGYASRGEKLPSAFDVLAGTPLGPSQAADVRRLGCHAVLLDQLRVDVLVIEVGDAGIDPLLQRREYRLGRGAVKPFDTAAFTVTLRERNAFAEAADRALLDHDFHGLCIELAARVDTGRKLAPWRGNALEQLWVEYHVAVQLEEGASCHCLATEQQRN